MADPLSITASIIAVIGAAEGVSKGFSKIKDIRKAPSDLLALMNEVSDLSVILGDVESNIRHADRVPLPREQTAHMSALIQRAKDRLLELDQLIQFRLVKPATDKIKISRREWTIAKPTITKLRESLRDIRLNLLTQMVAMNV